jgi:ribonuclease E
MKKRSASMIAAAGLTFVVVVGVVYATASFASVFSCEAGSACFFASFFAPARNEPEPPSSTTLTSSAPPSAQQGPAIEVTGIVRAPPDRGPSPEPSALPPPSPSAASAGAQADAAASAPSVPEQAAPPVAAEEAPPVDTAAPDGSAAPATSIAAVPTAPAEPEPGVLTDPPAGVVLDENTTTGGAPGVTPPNVLLPVLIIPPAGRAR